MATDERRREWAKNFGKSVGYSAKVSLTSIAPNVSTTAGSVVEVVRDIRQLGTKIKNLHRQEDTQLSKTKLGKSAKTIFDTAMNDLRTGNFGMRKEVGNNIDDLSSFLDDELDSTYSFGDDDTDLSELSPEEIILNGTEGVARTVAASSAAQMKAMQSTAKEILGSNLKMTKASTDSIVNAALFSSNLLNSSLVKMNSTLDNINKNLVSIINYHNENLNPVNEAMLNYFDQTSEMISSIGQMFATMQDYEYGKQSKAERKFDMMGGFSLSNYKEYVKEGIKESLIGTVGTLFENKEMFGDMFGIGRVKSDPLGLLTETIIKAIIPKNVKASIGKFDTAITRSISERLKKISDWQPENTMVALAWNLLGIGDIFGSKRTTGKQIINMGTFSKEAMPWNGYAQKALTEVIPEYLSDINVAVNKIAKLDDREGQTEDRKRAIQEYRDRNKWNYDYEQGQFRKQSDIKKSFFGDIQNSFMDVSNVLESIQNAYKYDQDKQNEITKSLDKLINERQMEKKNSKEFASELSTILSELKQRDPHNFTKLSRRLVDALESGNEEVLDMFNSIGASGNNVYRTINLKSREEAYRKYNEGKSYSDKGRYETRTYAPRLYAGGVSIRGYIESRISALNLKTELLDDQETIDYVRKKMLTGEGIKDPTIANKIDKFLLKRNSQVVVQGSLDELFGGSSNKIFQRLGLKKSTDPDSSAYKLSKKLDKVSDELINWAYGFNVKDESGNAPDGSTPPSGNIPPNSPPPKKSSNRANDNVIYLDQDQAFDGSNVLALSAPAEESNLSQGKSSSKVIDINRKRLAANGIKTFGRTNPKRLHKRGATNSSEAISQRAVDVLAKGNTDAILNSGNTQISSRTAQMDKAVKDLQTIAPADTLEQSIINANNATVTYMASTTNTMQSLSSKLFGRNGLLHNFWDSEAGKDISTKTKEYFFNEETGVLADEKKEFKEKRHNYWEKVKDNLSGAYNFLYENTAKYIFGENYKENENYQKYMAWADWKGKREAKKAKLLPAPNENLAEGKSSQHTPEVLEEAKNEIVETSEDLSDKISPKTRKVYGKKLIRANARTVKSFQHSKKKSGSEIISDAIMEASDNIVTASEDLAEDISSEDKEKIAKANAKAFKDRIKGILPKATVGALIGLGIGGLSALTGGGLIGAAFLPDGPIGGAIVGSGIAILSQTEAIRSLLFGKMDEKTGERSGGLISKKLKESFKKSLPLIVGGGVFGALRHILLPDIGGDSALGIVGNILLPNNILGGALLGSAFALLKNNEKVQTILFGEKDENGKRTGKFLSKSWNKASDGMGKIFPTLMKGVKGLGIGALTGAVLSNMGFIPAMFSLGGPVGMGLAGLGIGLASSSKKFNEFLFGTELLDKDGNPTGKKTTGLLTRTANIIRVNVIDPISQKFVDSLTNLVDWLKKSIEIPFRKAFGPILDSIHAIKDNIVDYVKDKFDRLADGITSILKSTINKLFSPFTKFLGFMGSTIVGGLAKTAELSLLPTSLGLRTLAVATSGRRKEERKAFRRAYYSHLGETLSNMWFNMDQEGNSRSVFGKFVDTVSALAGRGEIGEAAKNSYNRTMKSMGRNHLNYMGAEQDAKKYKDERKQHKDEQKMWRRIDKARTKIAKELGGREVELSGSKFSDFKRSLVKAGIDPDQITSSDDIMKLVYHKSEWKNGSITDRLKDFAKNGIKADNDQWKKTESFYDESKEYLRNIVDRMEEEAINRATKLNEFDKYDTKKAKKILKRKARANNIEFSDREYEAAVKAGASYDLFDDDFFQEYYASEEYKTGDFDRFLLRYQNKGNAMVGANKTRKRLKAHYYQNPYGMKSLKDTLKSRNVSSTEELLSNILDVTKENVGLAKESNKLSEQNSAISSKIAAHEATQTEVATEGAVTDEDVSSQIVKSNGKSSYKGKFRPFSALKTWGASFLDKFTINEDEALTNELEAEEEKQKLANQSEKDKKARAGTRTLVPIEKKEVAKLDKDQSKSGKFFDALVTKVFGGALSLGSTFARTKAGSLLIRAIKKGGLFYGATALAIGIADIIKPGFQNNLIRQTDEFAAALESGNIYDDFVKPVFDKLTNKIGEGIDNLGEIFPTLWDNTIFPAFSKITSTLFSNVDRMVEVSKMLIDNVGVPLTKAAFQVIPHIAKTIGKAAWNSTIGKVFPPLRIGDAETTESGDLETAESKGAYVKVVDPVTGEVKYVHGGSATEHRNDVLGMTVDENGQVVDVQYVNSNEHQGTVLNAVTRMPIGMAKSKVLGKGTVYNIGKKLVSGIGGVSSGVVSGISGAFLPINGKAAAASGYAVGKKAASGSAEGLTNVWSKVTQKGINAANRSKLQDEIIDKAIKNTAESSIISAAMTDAATDTTENLNKLFGDSIAKQATEMGVNLASEESDEMVRAMSKKLLKQTDSAILTNTLDNTARYISSEAAGQAGKAIVKEAKNEAAKSALRKIIDKAKNAFAKAANSKVLSKAIQMFIPAGANGQTIIAKVLKKLSEFLEEKALKLLANDKLLSKYGARLLSKLSKAALGASPLLVLFAGYDLITGATKSETAKLFNVDKDDVTLGMRAVSALMKALLGTTVGIFVDILLEIMTWLGEKDVKCIIASKIYGIFAPEILEDELAEAQNSLSVKVAAYNAANPDSQLDENSYLEAVNQPWYKKIYSKITGNNKYEKVQNFDKNYSSSSQARIYSTTQSEINSVIVNTGFGNPAGYGANSTITKSGRKSLNKLQNNAPMMNRGYGILKKRNKPYGYGNALGYGISDLRTDNSISNIAATSAPLMYKEDYSDNVLYQHRVERVKYNITESAINIVRKFILTIKSANFLKNVLKFLAPRVDLAGKLYNAVFKTFNWVIKELEAVAAKDPNTVEAILSKVLLKSGDIWKTAFKILPPVGLVLSLYDTVNGYASAANLFHVSESAVDWKMRVISSLMGSFLSSGAGAVISAIIEILTIKNDKDYKSLIATKIYNLFSDDADKKLLSTNQKKFKTRYKLYNTVNKGNKVSEFKWNNTENKSLLGRAVSAIKNKFNIFGKSKETVNSYGYGNPRTTLSQSDPRWRNITIGTMPDGSRSTMSDGGCGPTSLAIVASQLSGMSINPGEIGRYAAQSGYITDGGANAGLFTDGATRLGMSSYELPNGRSLLNSIASGTPTIISGVSNSSNDPYTRAGHIVVANGIDAAGNVVIKDPIDGSIKSYDPLNVINHATGGWAYGYGDINPYTVYNKSNLGYGILGTTTVAKSIADAEKKSGSKVTTGKLKSKTIVSTRTTADVKAELKVISDFKASNPTEYKKLNKEVYKKYGKYLPYIGSSTKYHTAETKYAYDLIVQWKATNKQTKSASKTTTSKGIPTATTIGLLKAKDEDRYNYLYWEATNKYAGLSGGVNKQNTIWKYIYDNWDDKAGHPTDTSIVKSETTWSSDIDAVSNGSETMSNGSETISIDPTREGVLGYIASTRDQNSTVTNFRSLLNVLSAMYSSFVDGEDKWAAAARALEESANTESSSSDSNATYSSSNSTATIGKKTITVPTKLRINANTFKSKSLNERISLVSDFVKEVAVAASVPPSLIMGIANTEQSFGGSNSSVWLKANNLFSIKKGSWTGPTYNGWRQYSSVGESILDEGRAMGTWKYLSGVRSATTPDAAYRAFTNSSYITDGDGRTTYYNSLKSFAKAHPEVASMDSVQGWGNPVGYGEPMTYAQGFAKLIEGLSQTDYGRRHPEIFGSNSSSVESTDSNSDSISYSSTIPSSYTGSGNTAAQYVKNSLANSRISSPYGYRKHPITGQNKMHNGIDFAAPAGTKIYTPVSGTVSRSENGYNGGFGNLVVVKDSKGYEHYFAHQSKRAANKGSKVSKGSLIGYVGTTGASTGNHLHYGIKNSGGWMNPANYRLGLGYGRGNAGNLNLFRANNYAKISDLSTSSRNKKYDIPISATYYGDPVSAANIFNNNINNSGVESRLDKIGKVLDKWYVDSTNNKESNNTTIINSGNTNTTNNGGSTNINQTYKKQASTPKLQNEKLKKLHKVMAAI